MIFRLKIAYNLDLLNKEHKYKNKSENVTRGTEVRGVGFTNLISQPISYNPNFAKIQFPGR